MKWQPITTPTFFDFDHVIDARAAFEDKRRRDELRRGNPFMLFADMAAVTWAMALSSFFWAF